MRPRIFERHRHQCTSIWIICIVLATAFYRGAAAPRGRDVDDDSVIVQLEDSADDAALDSLKALQQQRDLHDCAPLVGSWVSCRLAPAAAASTAAANNVIQQLAAVQVMGKLKGILGTSASTAAAPRRAFRRVGRGKRVFVSIRTLAQQDAAAPPAPAAADKSAAADAGSGMTPAGALPAECSGGSCRLWNLNRIGAPAVWRQMGSSMPLANVARPGSIIDTGADFFNNNVAPQVDKDKSTTITIATQKSAISEGGKAGESSHGTHVFGTAAGAWGGGDPTGVAGVLGPSSGSIVSCNVFGNNGDVDGASINDIVRCLAHARKNNAHWVVNLSLGGEWSRSDAVVGLLRDGLNTQICDGGGVVVAAAHNFKQNVNDPSSDTATFPAAYAGDEVPCLIAVASIDQGDRLSSFSNFGTSVKIAAPGGSIVSSTNSNSGANVWATGQMSGTSMASPHVAGSAMLLMNAFPSATGSQVKDCLLSTATDPVKVDPGSNAVLGGGILNVQAAYDCLAAVAAPETPDCTARTVPTCVDASTGILDSTCTENTSSYFCASVSSSQRCRYAYKPAGTVCNTASGAACSGSRASCPRQRPSPSRPTTNPAKKTDCSTDTLQQCEVEGVCTAAQGCTCNPARQSLSDGCLCAASLGFVPITAAETGLSRCRWNVSFSGLRYMSVPLDGTVVLPLKLSGPGGTMCPPAGSSMIESVTITDPVACSSSGKAQAILQSATAAAASPGERCGGYVLKTFKEGATSGSCYRLRVHTTDKRNYNLVFMYQ